MYYYLNSDLLSNVLIYLLKFDFNLLLNQNIANFIIKYNTLQIRYILTDACSEFIKIKIQIKEIDNFFNNFNSLINYNDIWALRLLCVTENFALKWNHFIPMKTWVFIDNLSFSFVDKFHSELDMFELYKEKLLTREMVKKYYIEIKNGDYYGGSWGRTDTLQQALDYYDDNEDSDE